MIDPISSQISAFNLMRDQQGVGPSAPAPIRLPDQMRPAEGDESMAVPGKDGNGFSDLVTGLVRSVDEKTKVADTEVRRLMLGESDNIHRSMIAMQESGLAFDLLVEVRNKLVESYQELMRMPV